jgi:hypothetical protein
MINIISGTIKIAKYNMPPAFSSLVEGESWWRRGPMN